MKSAFLLLSLLSLSAFAKVEEIELGTCYKAVAPKQVRAVPIRACNVYLGNSQQKPGGFQMVLTYNYTAVVETLIVITNDHGMILSEKVYKKTLPRTENLTSSENSCEDIDKFSDISFEHFESFYEGLLANQC